MKKHRPSLEESHSELLILADGSILTHNLTVAMAALLVELNPVDSAMRQRAGMEPLPSTVPLVHIPQLSPSS